MISLDVLFYSISAFLAVLTVLGTAAVVEEVRDVIKRW